MLQQGEVSRWLAGRAREHGYQLERDAAEMIANFIGTELGILDNALHQLATYVGPGAAITSEAVETCLISTRVHIVWDLTDALGDRNLSYASTLIRNLIDGGEDGLQILGAMSYRLRLLFKVRELLERGVRRCERSNKAFLN